MSKNCLETKDHLGSKVVFTEKQRQQKSLKHPELREKGFIKRIEVAIKSPDFIYEDLAKNDRLVYYKYEYSLNGRDQYIKVVLKRQSKFYFVITAYRPDFMKEKGKSKLLYEK